MFVKKLVIILCTVLVSLSLCACNLLDDSGRLDIDENGAYDSDIISGTDSSFIFTYLSYMEIKVKEEYKSEELYKKHMLCLFESMKKIGVTDCFVQVRPYADALYESKLFPKSEYCAKADFDVLNALIFCAKQYNIAVHAWINPYRCGDNWELLGLEKDSDAFINTPSGMYLNPASTSAQRLIIEGARELMEGYDIKGIHIDDYFYPPDVNSADEESYEAYKKSSGKMSLANWRRENVSSLVAALYSMVKTYGEDKIFSISPAGDIDKDINEMYADVKKWCEKDGYCDLILPQLYFGFDNESLPFEKLLLKWCDIVSNNKSKLVPVLAMYKCGKKDVYAGQNGENEWIENSDIIKRQYLSIKSQGLKSVALYSGSYINFSETFLSKELYNLKNVL